MVLFGKQKIYSLFMGEPNPYDLLETAEKYSFSGNIWQNIISLALIEDENPYSLSCERKKSGKGSLETYALKDIGEIRRIFEKTPSEYNYYYTPMHSFDYAEDFQVGGLARQLTEALCLTSSDEEFLSVLSSFYARYGVGCLGLNKAFYLDEEGNITPVSHFRKVDFSDLWGYESQKKKMIENTEAFLLGKGSNNMLLYGDAGTGKSTSVKALLNRYWKDGLRMIQVQKYQFHFLNRVIDQIRPRNYRFVLFLDDLSFEDFEIEYKYLKAAIEGGLEERSENMLIFATSNRRHLVKETFSDREGGGDIHRDESIQEKVSLSDRFGLQIRFSKPAQDEYYEIVCHLASLYELDIPQDELLAGAGKFSVLHGGFSGRIATQYILSLIGKQEESDGKLSL
jgi:hypothetical protein